MDDLLSNFRSVSNVGMTYGGMRRRPGPLLGGSAILTQRTNQQRIQYLQQLENIVHQKERQHSYTNHSMLTTNQKSSPQLITISSHKSPPNTVSEPVDHTFIDEEKHSSSNQENNNCSIATSYPDLLSHEVPQHKLFITNQQRGQINQDVLVQTPVHSLSEMSSKSGIYLKLFTITHILNSGIHNNKKVCLSR